MAEYGFLWPGVFGPSGLPGSHLESRGVLMEEIDGRVDTKKILGTVFDLVRSFVRIFEPQKYVEEMSTMEFYVLLYIFLKGPQKMHELAEAYSTTRSNITVIVDGMEKDGYVRRERSKADRRVIYIHLTKKGKEVGDETAANFSRVVNSFLKTVPGDDAKVVHDAFERMENLFVEKDVHGS